MMQEFTHVSVLCVWFIQTGQTRSVFQAGLSPDSGETHGDSSRAAGRDPEPDVFVALRILNHECVSRRLYREMLQQSENMRLSCVEFACSRQDMQSCNREMDRWKKMDAWIHFAYVSSYSFSSCGWAEGLQLVVLALLELLLGVDLELTVLVKGQKVFEGHQSFYALHISSVTDPFC